MSTLAETRTALAAVLAAVDSDLTVYETQPKSAAYGDTWLTVEGIDPGDFNETYAVSYTAVVILGTDLTKAETRFDTLAPALVAAVLGAGAWSVKADAVAVQIPSSSTPAALNAIALSLTVEVTDA